MDFFPIWPGPLSCAALNPIVITCHATTLKPALLESMCVFPIHPWFIYVIFCAGTGHSPYSVGAAHWNYRRRGQLAYMLQRHRFAAPTEILQCSSGRPKVWKIFASIKASTLQPHHSWLLSWPHPHSVFIELPATAAIRATKLRAHLYNRPLSQKQTLISPNEWMSLSLFSLYQFIDWRLFFNSAISSKKKCIFFPRQQWEEVEPLKKYFYERPAFRNDKFTKVVCFSALYTFMSTFIKTGIWDSPCCWALNHHSCHKDVSPAPQGAQAHPHPTCRFHQSCWRVTSPQTTPEGHRLALKTPPVVPGSPA